MFRDDQHYIEAFPFKQELENALMSASQNMGLEQFLSIVPYNIEEGEPKRPYLISIFLSALDSFEPRLIPASPFGPNRLEFFASVLVPLSNRLFSRCLNLWKFKREREAKLLETLALQIWQLLPGFCATVPGDLASGFPILAPILGRVLQSEGGKPLIDENGQDLTCFANIDLRPIVCKSLQILVENTLKLVEITDMPPKVRETVNQSLCCLESFSNRFLAALCNNFTAPDDALIRSVLTQTLAQQQAKGIQGISGPGLVASCKNQLLQSIHDKDNQHGEVAIKAFLLIANEEAITNYFMNLVKTLLSLQTEASNEMGDLNEDSVQILQKNLRIYSIIDLLIILLPQLPISKRLAANNASPADFVNDSPISVFYRVLIGQLEDTDVTIQKRSYKALNYVVGLLLPKNHSINFELVFELLSDLVLKLTDAKILSLTGSGAKKSRMELIERVVDLIPLVGSGQEKIEDSPSQKLLLEFVPLAVSEVMLATKEASEKARTAAYEALATMAKKMISAGQVFGFDQTQGFSNSMDQDDSSNILVKDKLNFNEFLMMVVAGLAGQSSNMQSAAIACVARLLFEFNEQMSKNLIDDLIGTILMMLKSNSREVIKAALGFVKVVVVTIEPNLLVDHLETMIISMLSHSRTHTSHFKLKIRHIFERLIRKFSYEAVEGFVPETDKKLMVNIKKRRERMKKKKMEDPKEKVEKMPESRQKAFEEVMQDSDESDLGSDNEGAPVAPKSRKAKTQVAKVAATQIREDDDQVLDFLSSNVVSQVANVRKGKKSDSNPSQKKQEFEFNAKGRLIIHDEEKEAERMKKLSLKSPLPNSGSEYLAALKSEVAIQKTASGKTKFVNKRKRDEDDLPEEDEEEEKEKVKKDGIDKKALDKMLGRQFKAKNARGDVKKGGVDPYAYIPLDSKVGGKGRKRMKAQGQFKNIIKAAQKGAKN